MKNASNCYNCNIDLDEDRRKTQRRIKERRRERRQRQIRGYVTRRKSEGVAFIGEKEICLSCINQYGEGAFV